MCHILLIREKEDGKYENIEHSEFKAKIAQYTRALTGFLKIVIVCKWKKGVSEKDEED